MNLILARITTVLVYFSSPYKKCLLKPNIFLENRYLSTHLIDLIQYPFSYSKMIIIVFILRVAFIGQIIISYNNFQFV